MLGLLLREVCVCVCPQWDGGAKLRRTELLYSCSVNSIGREGT